MDDSISESDYGSRAMSEAPSIGSCASSESKKHSFFVDWDKGVSGVISKSGVYVIKNDFAIKIDCFIEAGNSTGFLATVKREHDGKRHECFFTSGSVHRREKFMDLLNSSFGSGGMTCGLDMNVLPSFIQYLKRQYDDGRLPTKTAILRPGRIGCGLYFFNETVAVDENGEIVDISLTNYIWLKKDFIGESDKISVSDIIPNIILPLNCNVLKTIITNLKMCLKHNFIPSLLVLAGAVMSFHYQKILSFYGGCSIVMASGPSSTGKTTAIKGTNRGFLERSSISTLPYGIDDPKTGGKAKSSANKLDLCELAVDLYNGSPTTNYSTGILVPISIPIIATNFGSVAEERACSRILEIKFSKPTCGPKSLEEFEAFQSLSQDLKNDEYSCAAGFVVKMGKDLNDTGFSEYVKNIQEDLQVSSHLMERNVCGWSIILYFLKQILDEVSTQESSGNIDEVSGSIGDEVSETDVNAVTSNHMCQVYFQRAKNFVIDMLKDSLRPADEVLPVAETASSQVFTFCDQLTSKAVKMPLNEVLTFMRCCSIDQDPAVAVYATKAAVFTTYSVSAINKAVRSSGLGRTQDKRAYLKSGCGDMVIKENNSVRQSGIVLFLKDARWPSVLLGQFEKG